MKNVLLISLLSICNTVFSQIGTHDLPPLPEEAVDTIITTGPLTKMRIDKSAGPIESTFIMIEYWRYDNEGTVVENDTYEYYEGKQVRRSNERWEFGTTEHVKYRIVYGDDDKPDLKVKFVHREVSGSRKMWTSKMDVYHFNFETGEYELVNSQ